MNRDSAAGFGIGMLVGALAGLAVGFLYAPKSGSEMRGMIRERATEVGDKVKDRLNKFRGKAGEIQEDISEHI